MVSDQISISKFSMMTRLSTKALRLYDEKQLLEPQFRDPMNNYRYYSVDQLGDALKIKLLASMGFGIEEMKSIIDAMYDENTDFLEVVFKDKQNEIRKEIIRLQQLEEIIRTHNPMELLFLKCSNPEIKSIPRMRVLSKNEKGSYSTMIPEMISQLMQVVFSRDNQQNMLRMAGPLMFLTSDEEFKEEDADITMAVPITGKVKIDDETIELKNLEACDVVSVVFTGPYNEIGTAYSRAFEFAQSNGFTISKPTRELYLNDPNKVDAEHLMTEVQIPVVR